MLFEFNPGTKVDTAKWMQTNLKLKRDLVELANGLVPENEIVEYVKSMKESLRLVENGKCENMQFLMFDEPSSMPADARVDFVYLPTYLAATIMMTAMCRYEIFESDEAFKKTLHEVLNATLGRKFLGAGYEENSGFMNTLEIFATGDTFDFVEKFPKLNERFTVQLVQAVTFLETALCTGEVVEPWSGDTYCKRANQVLKLIKK